MNAVWRNLDSPKFITETSPVLIGCTRLIYGFSLLKVYGACRGDCEATISLPEVHGANVWEIPPA